MHLELHNSIKETSPKYDEMLAHVWEFVKKAPSFQHKHLQTNEFLLFHLTAHAAYHFVSGGCGLRTILDLWLLEAKLEFERDVFCKTLKETELFKFYDAVSSLGQYWFGEKKDVSQIVLEVEKYVLLGGAYGTLAQRVASKQAKKGGKIKYLWSRIFLPYESLAILYPIIKKHKILTPFCQVARWFKGIFKGKRVAKEIKAVATTGNEQMENTKKLLLSLGL